MTKRYACLLVIGFSVVALACNKKDEAVSTTPAPAVEAPAPLEKVAAPAPTSVPASETTPAAAHVAIINAVAFEPGVVTGGQPTEAQFREAKEKGFKVIINTRAEGEPGVDGAKAFVEGLGMKYVWIPMKGADGLTKENAQALADALSDDNKPAMVHCGSGNRVGGLFAMKAFHIDGKSAEEALAIGKKAGLTRLEAAVKEKLVK